ncbi:MAG: hypothetical protein SCALA702_16910 [Melioribacteraceae bacterium]|nr:MAG: hypothetical protein SCALA702_16910 [Melioribacteraceae bacterium]
MLKRFLIVVALFGIYACSDKFDLNEAVGNLEGEANLGDTLFVQQFPVWEGFSKPEAMIVGREPFIYVADTENDRVVMLNLAGEILGSIDIPHPNAIAQDYKLNLIVCGEFDTLGTTYSAVYKINMFDAGNIISDAPVKRVLPKSSLDYANPQRKYTGAAVFGNGVYYIARTGTVNNSPVNPDNSILMFATYENQNGVDVDTLIGRVPEIAPDGTGLVSANGITSLTSFNKNNIDVIVTLGGENSFRTQWWTYVVTPIYQRYESKLSAFSSRLMEVNVFERPEGTTVDPSDNVYVADAAKDSVFKFSSFGDQLEAFGGETLFPDKPLNEPHDVAYFDRTLYVLDTGNDRILRFILSTDLE